MVLQMEAVECGAAALAIILGYYKRIVPLAVLRRECGVSRDGSKCSNVCKAARNYGLVAKAFKKDLPGLKGLRYPYIVFWNFNHFLVVEGYRHGQVYLNDPASGPRSVDLEEFDESYTGVVMVMEPGPEFRPGGRKKSMVASIRERLKGSLRPLLFAAFTALLLVLPGLATPALTADLRGQGAGAGLQRLGPAAGAGNDPGGIAESVSDQHRAARIALHADQVGRFDGGTLRVAAVPSAGGLLRAALRG